MESDRKRILIVNQHSENRGDEEAMKAMIRAISKNFPLSEFCVVAQFRDRNLQIFSNDTQLIKKARLHNMLIPSYELPGFCIYLILRILNIEADFLLGKKTANIIREYKNCDLVISAPGGPYFGDIYSGFLSSHELAHLLMVYLAFLFKKKTILYAPSAGPFRKKWINPLRKLVLGGISKITVRDQISRKYLKELIPTKEILLSADSVIQDQFKPVNRSEYYQNSYEKFRNRYIVALSIKDISEESALQSKNNNYEKILIGLIKKIAQQMESHFVFFPQLYGAVHDDTEFLERFTSKIKKAVSLEIINVKNQPFDQKSLWAIADFTISSRYHPVIFSSLNSIPFLCLSYQHKQTAFCRMMKMDEFCFDISDLNSDKLVNKWLYIVKHNEKIRNRIEKNITALKKLSELSTKLSVDLLMQQ